MDLSEVSRDEVTAQLAMDYHFSCLTAFALLPRGASKLARGTRCVGSLLTAAALVLGQPLLYRSPTQPSGMLLSSMAFPAA